MGCINVLVGCAVQSCTVCWVENLMWANVQCQLKISAAKNTLLSSSGAGDVAPLP